MCVYVYTYIHIWMIMCMCVHLFVSWQKSMLLRLKIFLNLASYIWKYGLKINLKAHNSIFLQSNLTGIKLRGGFQFVDLNNLHGFTMIIRSKEEFHPLTTSNKNSSLNWSWKILSFSLPVMCLHCYHCYTFEIKLPIFWIPIVYMKYALCM